MEALYGNPHSNQVFKNTFSQNIKKNIKILEILWDLFAHVATSLQSYITDEHFAEINYLFSVDR